MSNEDKLKIYNENENLVYFTIKKYYSDYLFDEDMIQECKLALWKCINKFDPHRNIKFSTFAVRCIIMRICQINRISNMKKEKDLLYR